MCCDFAAGEPRQPGYRCWEKQLPPIRDAGITRGGGDRPTCSPPSGDKGQEGAATRLSRHHRAPISPPSRTPPARVSLPCTQQGEGRPAGASSQTARSRGDICPNSEVGAIASGSSFLWERKGARRCVNKQPLPQAAPREGRGRLGCGTPRGASSWDGGDSLPWGIVPRERLLFPDRPFNQPNSAWKKNKPKKSRK